jgi:hypothetical protein
MQGSGSGSNPSCFGVCFRVEVWGLAFPWNDRFITVSHLRHINYCDDPSTLYLMETQLTILRPCLPSAMGYPVLRGGSRPYFGIIDHDHPRQHKYHAISICIHQTSAKPV